uniref:BatD family protein n=1 Tax=Candidatus Cryptobacteroides bacterium TaxID=3085639 RepID=UPI004028AE15
MKKLFCIVAFLLTAIFQMSAQNVIRVEAPDVVAVNEQFNVTFIIEGEKSPSDFQWSSGDDFQLVWGPQKGSSSSIQIINGKRSSSHQTTFTYILIPKATGTFQLPVATALLSGDRISSTQASIQVVSDGASSSQSSGQNGGKSSGGGQTSSTGSGEISSNDLFMRLSLSRTEVVIGEPITATLKIYQRANVVGFENAKFPTFNGFWSQETYVPNNIEFKRESLDDKIYNTAVLRTYVLIPQQSGTITIDPAELVCLVNIRTAPSTSNSLFDSFFQDEYRTIRKRVTTPAVKVKVNPLPAGQPASFGGGVGNFGISARLTTDNLKTHDAASLIITVSGRGNVALLEEPKVNFPPDFEVYDTKTTENTDKSNGGTSGSKSFEYPFIPRSHGDFTIDPVEYSYYDVNAGKYVTLRTEPLHVKVAKGKGGDSTPVTTVNSGVERKDVKSLADDIRFIFTGKPGLSGSGSFFVGSVFFWILLALMILGATSVYLAFRKVAAMRADVAGTKNRRATKMAQKRLKLAGEYLDKNLYTAFYEELHKALIGFVSDKLNMDMSEISKDNIASALTEGGVSEEQTKAFTDLLDACEFARYSPDGGNEAMRSHYDAALKVISSIDSGLKTGGKSLRKVVTVVTLLLSLGASMNIQAKDLDSLWTAGVQAYTDGKFSDASAAWTSIEESGQKSAKLYYNLGNAWFKQGNYPKAILNYERALRLDPSYSDARYNLEFTSNFVQDKIEPVPEFILKSVARKVCYVMGSNAWAVIFLVLLAAALVMGLLFLLGSSVGKRRAGFYCGIVLLLLSAGALSFSIWQKSDSVKTDTAIVMSPVSSVKSSPSSGSSKDLFVIHEGTKVTILDEVGSWKNIALADGRQGWITSNELEVI